VPRRVPDTQSPPPDWLDEPLRAILHDLQQPRPIPLRYGFSEDADGAWLWIEELGVPGATGVWIPPETEGAALTAWLADHLQEQFFPESAAAWGEARPACPGHGHPAIASADGDEAWWRCPADHRRIAVIGGYGSTGM
jgi:hypothetical protein